jgi:hypothetical protein
MFTTSVLINVTNDSVGMNIRAKAQKHWLARLDGSSGTIDSFREILTGCRD